jgi:hypothetical protein
VPSIAFIAAEIPMRKIALSALPALMLLSACQNRPSSAAPAAVASTARAQATTAPTHASAPSGTGTSSAADSELRPQAPRKIVDDTTPVDTLILDVKLSDNSDGKRLTGIMTDRFKSSDGVFLSIRTKGTASKYTLSSRWLDPTGKRLTEYSQIIVNAGQTDTVFSLSKPDGWPKGRYQVELSINGKPLRTVPFTVQ